MKLRLSLLEIFLLEMVVFLGLWLIYDFVAAFLTLIVGAIVSAVLIIALIAEIIERSKVPKMYFKIMAITILALFLSATIYLTLLGGNVAFLQKS